MNKKTEIDQEKKEWEKPQLIVLARGEPEEAVLGGCKGNSTTNSGDNACGVTNPCINHALS